MAKASSHKKMVIPSKSSQIAKVQKAILKEVERHGFTEKEVFGIRLALDEALANAINHGNCGDPKKKVVVDFTVDGQDLEISITDEGCGFVPDKVPDPTLDENLTKPCGRGVMLMKAYMDEVWFNDTGNCVTLRKHHA